MTSAVARWLTCALLVALVAPASAFAQSRPDLALRQPATASSFQQTSDLAASQTCIPCLPAKANDGDRGTRWGSAFSDAAPWWQVDLGAARSVDSVRLDWELSFATLYRIDTSLDGGTFTPAATQSLNSNRPVTTRFAARSARLVRVTGLARARSDKGISFWRAEVFGPTTFDPPAAPAPAPVALATGAPTATSTRPSLLAPFPIVRIRGEATSTGALVRLLSVRAPRGARIDVRCRGRRCPRRLVLRSRGVNRIRPLERYLRAGTVIEVRVSRPGRLGKYTRFRVRRGRAPARFDSCVLAGARRPTGCT